MNPRRMDPRNDCDSPRLMRSKTAAGASNLDAENTAERELRQAIPRKSRGVPNEERFITRELGLEQHVRREIEDGSISIASSAVVAGFNHDNPKNSVKQPKRARNFGINGRPDLTVFNVSDVRSKRDNVNGATIESTQLMALNTKVKLNCARSRTNNCNADCVKPNTEESTPNSVELRNIGVDPSVAKSQASNDESLRKTEKEASSKPRQETNLENEIIPEQR